MHAASHHQQEARELDQRSPALPFWLLLPGLVLGMLLSAALLSGASDGSVNLFWLLLYFVVLPCVGLLFSLAFLRRDARGLAGLLLHLPWLPAGWSRTLLALDEGHRRLWFFCGSQCLVLGVAFGNILAYLLILLFRDVYFGWQSTLLDADAAAAIFRFFAWPWRFWEAAQADQQLIVCTRVGAMGLFEPADSSPDCHRQWWRYLLAAQLCYSLLPRSLMWFWSWRALVRASKGIAGQTATMQIDPVPPTKVLAPLARTLQGPYLLVRWDAVPDAVQAEVQARIGVPQAILHAGPLATAEQEQASLAAKGARVILLKGWEPPMARLGDYLDLQPAAGCLLPLDWNTTGLAPLRDNYLQEWQRFCALHPGWQVLQPEVAA